MDFTVDTVAHMEEPTRPGVHLPRTGGEVTKRHADNHMQEPCVDRGANLISYLSLALLPHAPIKACFDTAPLNQATRTK